MTASALDCSGQYRSPHVPPKMESSSLQLVFDVLSRPHNDPPSLSASLSCSTNLTVVPWLCTTHTKTVTRTFETILVWAVLSCETVVTFAKQLKDQCKEGEARCGLTVTSKVSSSGFRLPFSAAHVVIATSCERPPLRLVLCFPNVLPVLVSERRQTLQMGQCIMQSLDPCSFTELYRRHSLVRQEDGAYLAANLGTRVVTTHGTTLVVKLVRTLRRLWGGGCPDVGADVNGPLWLQLSGISPSLLTRWSY